MCQTFFLKLAQKIGNSIPPDLRKIPKYLMHLSFASPCVDPWDTPGEPSGTQREWYSFGISFSPAAEGNCVVLETTFLDHGDIPTGLVRGSGTGNVKSSSMVSKKRAKNWMHLFVIFANEK